MVRKTINELYLEENLFEYEIQYVLRKLNMVIDVMHTELTINSQMSESKAKISLFLS